VNMAKKKLADFRGKDIRRREQTVSPLTVFHVFSEGAKTEPSYLKALFAKFPKIPVELDLMAPAGVPETVATKAIAAREAVLKQNDDLPNDAFDKREQYWVVFDCDSDLERFNAATRRCQASSIKLACSDPCFELWLILHFCSYGKGDNQAAVQSSLRQFCPEYHPVEKKEVDFNKLWPLIDQAERRSAAQVRARQQDGAARPQTTFGDLVQALRSHSGSIGRVALEPLSGIGVIAPTTKKRHGKK